jgi:hypothetical protein
MNILLGTLYEKMEEIFKPTITGNEGLRKSGEGFVIWWTSPI